ncbi:NADH:flavin oxidoreductase [Gordonibacter sp. 28C]|nr:NADH:flavin oxidoreductase [Gordonibacter sp. 28C]
MLFEPIMIGNKQLRNRTALLPMGMEVDEYYMSDKLVDLYSQMSKGGIGMITVGGVIPCDCSNVSHQYPAGSHSIGAWSDDFIPGLKKLTDGIREGGALSCAQLDIHYEWRADGSKPFEAVGPSDGPGGPFVKKLRELTIDEIHLIVEQFGDACRRCKEAGFDLVEIHAGIGYLLCRFLSSFSNRRTDQYGGSIENRARIVCEVIENCRKKAGEDFPIVCRFNADDYMPGGNTMDDAKALISIFEKCGVAAFSIQAGFHEATRPLVNQFVPEAPLIDMTYELKKLAHVPVIAGYRIARADTCEEIIASGKADIVGMGRALLADPCFVGKMESNNKKDIRPCICCCRCLDSTFVGRKLTCSMNADIASDLGLPERSPAEKKKKVVVIGAGPGGMEAARVAAIRGHDVTLVDKGKHLGGLLNLAAVLNEFLEPVIDWYALQLRNLSVTTMLGTEASAALVGSLKPDAVVVSPGGEAIVPDIPGIDGKNIIGSVELKGLVAGKAPKKGLMWKCAAVGTGLFGNNKKFMRWGMSLPWPVKKNVVVIGGGFAGCEVAHSMMKGRRVTVLEPSSRPLRDMGPVTKGTQLDLLKKGGVTIMTDTVVKEVLPTGVLAVNTKTGEEIKVSADTVMPSLGVQENTTLFNELSKEFESVYLIGDGAGAQPAPEAKEGERPVPEWELARRIREAVRDGFNVGMGL